MYDIPTNDAIRIFITAEDTLTPLENLLKQEIVKLERIQKACKGRPAGKVMYATEVEEEFPTIKASVDNFLGCTADTPIIEVIGAIDPKRLWSEMKSRNWWSVPILSSFAFSALSFVLPFPADNIYLPLSGLLIGGYCWHRLQDQGSNYRKEEKCITLKKMKRTSAIPTLAHEYTHHVQNSIELILPEYHSFIEGHARGIDRMISEEYARIEENAAFEYASLDRSVGEFKSVYEWLTKRIEVQPRDDLLKVRSSRDVAERVYRQIYMAPTPHALGNVFFRIGELISGKDIYRLDYWKKEELESFR